MEDYFRLSPHVLKKEAFEEAREKGYCEALMHLDLAVRGVLYKTVVNICGVKVPLNEGEFAVTRKILAKAWGVPPRTVRYKMDKFCRDGDIIKVATFDGNINVYKYLNWVFLGEKETTVDSSYGKEDDGKDKDKDGKRADFMKDFISHFNNVTGKKITTAREVFTLYNKGYRDMALFKGVLDFKIKEYKSMNNHKYIRISSIFNVNRFEDNVDSAKAGGFVDKYLKFDKLESGCNVTASMIESYDENYTLHCVMVTPSYINGNPPISEEDNYQVKAIRTKLGFNRGITFKYIGKNDGDKPSWVIG